MFKNEKILIFAAHPDDEILGCGGFLSKYSSQNIFKVVFIAEGESCRIKKGQALSSFKKKILNRNKQSKKALTLFDIKNIKFYNLQCGCLNNIPQIKINKIIEKEIKNFNPTIILTHSINDLNSDHNSISKSVNVSVRPISNINKKIKCILNFEILSSSEWNLENAFKPNFFLKLKPSDLKKKIQALEVYEKEIREKPHSRSKYGLEVLARYRGLQIGEEYAESFKIVKLKC